MLGEQIERAIDDAWAAVRREILADPDELHRRLARRRQKSLTRPARAWCIAIRASDHRITAMHWLLTPEHAMDLNHPAHPYEPIEHTVTIQKHAIRRYCNPVSFSREQAVTVARMLGVSAPTLWYARNRGLFFEDRIKGLGGKRRHIPLLSPNGKIFDPGHGNFEPPHPVWGSSWEWLSHRYPKNFEQAITRRPVFHKARVRSKSVRNASPPLYHDDLKFRGWRWICPGCKKPVRTIYFPLPVRTMFDRWFIDPAKRLKLGNFNLPQAPPRVFACHKCHNIQFFSSIASNWWNQLVSYLSGGLLYGCEVPKPPGFVPERKKTRVRQVNRGSPRRDMVLRRLLNGWSNKRIARDMQITENCVGLHLQSLCQQYDVPDRHALVAKLGGAISPPLNQHERAAQRRFQVQTLLLQSLSLKEMMKQLKTDHDTLMRDIHCIYRHHGLPPTPGRNIARRALAKKLGAQLPPIGAELITQKVHALDAAGLSIAQIAKELHRCEAVIRHHLKKPSPREPVGAVSPRPRHHNHEPLP